GRSLCPLGLVGVDLSGRLVLARCWRRTNRLSTVIDASLTSSEIDLSGVCRLVDQPPLISRGVSRPICSCAALCAPVCALGMPAARHRESLSPDHPGDANCQGSGDVHAPIHAVWPETP